MVRNFLSGLALGGVVAGVGLGVASQLVPLDQDKVAEIMVAGDTLPAGDAAEALVEDKVGEVKAGEDTAGEDKAGEDTAGIVAAPTDANPAQPAADPDRAAASATDAPNVGPEAEKSDALLTPLPEVAAPETGAIAPDLTGVDEKAATGNAAKPEGAAPETAPTESAPDATATEATPSGAQGSTTKAAVGVETAPIDVTVPGDEPSAASKSEAAGVDADVADATEPATPPVDPAAKPVEPMVTPPAADAPTLPAANPLEPVGSLVDQEVAGVTSGRLPRIGAETTVPEAAGTLATSGVDAAQPPVVRFAQTFQNPSAKPLFAVLLLDPGTDDLNRAELAALPFSVTFVVDPMASNAAEAAKTYRAAGQEVVMLANGIPKGATASDLEQSFAKLTETLPEAVALIDTAEATFQDNRGLADEVVTLLAAQGRGVVTFDRGLNAADQVARREGVPSATIFRSLDDDGEDAPLIRRYLDRAAFKAAQEGQVVVIGTARAETIAALMEWAVEGRAASVALAPITAVMATK